MDIKELNRILRNKAIKFGLCDDWQQNIWNKDLSVPELLQIYIKGFDFSVKNDWLDYDFIKEVMSKEDLHEANIFIDENLDITMTDSGYAVFLGRCGCTLNVSGMKVVTVYVRHNSNVDVNATGGAMVFVHCYDDAEAIIYNDSYSKGFKYNH